jgi:hypothetical protein
MQQEHDSVANLELSYSLINQHVLDLVGEQRPNSVSIFSRVFCDNFLVDLIELDKVWPLQQEILEQLGALVLSRHKIDLIIISSNAFRL